MTVGTRTEIGSRKINEDYVLEAVQGEIHCLVVCDGLGGHDKGEVASKLVAETIISTFHRNPDWNQLEHMLQEAQDTLMKEQILQNATSEMKTTAVVLLTDGKQARWGHVGDSRLYHFYKQLFGMKYTRTYDHSVPQMLVASGKIKESEIRHHEDRNRLLRVMGVEWNTPRYEVSELVNVKKGSAFLLCTDGWWELIEETVMMDLLKKAGSAQEWLDAMAEYVAKAGAGTEMDNNSAAALII